MSNEELNQNDDDLLLDETLDDLADLPSTKPFPAGAHAVDLTVKRNPNKKPGSYIVEMVYVEPIEVGADVELPNAGDKSTVFISTMKKDGTKNEFGQGQLKLIMAPLADLYGTKSIGEIITQCASGVRCAVVTAIRKDKTGEYDDQQSIKAVQVM